MKLNLKILILVTTFVQFLSVYTLFSQNLSGLYDLIENKGKEIDNALNDIAEAGKITQEANTYYNEAQELQSNYDLDEKTLQKQLSKAEEKALSLQIKADKLYSGAYKTLNKICLDELQRSEVSYGESDSYVSSAGDMVNQAAEKRKEASDTRNPYEKATFLNDAAGLEGAAIENLITALQVQKGLTPEASPQAELEVQTEAYTTTTVTEESSLPYTAETYTYPTTIQQKSENLAIDQSVIQEYQDYVNDPSIPDPITINRDGVSGVSDVSIDNARDVFFSMETGGTPVYTAAAASGVDAQQEAIADSMAQIAQTTMEVSSIDQPVASTDIYPEFIEKEPTQEIQRGQFEDIVTEKQTREEDYTKKREALDLSYSQQSTGVRFMVQLAASRIPLSRSQLWALYPGNLSVEVVKEEGWYKYRIVNFRVFSEANRVALESGVKTAWVLSTQAGNPINLIEARNMTRVLESDIKRYGSKVIKDGTDFYIQLAASRTRLNDNNRESICGSAGACREVIEEGWFKYQVYAGTDYTKALEMKSRLAGKSFIVAYEKGTKVKLYKAVNR